MFRTTAEDAAENGWAGWYRLLERAGLGWAWGGVSRAAWDCGRMEIPSGGLAGAAARGGTSKAGPATGALAGTTATGSGPAQPNSTAALNANPAKGFTLRILIKHLKGVLVDCFRLA